MALKIRLHESLWKTYRITYKIRYAGKGDWEESLDFVKARSEKEAYKNGWLKIEWDKGYFNDVELVSIEPINT